MEQDIEQVAQAIAIAADPTQVSLHQQALDYLTTIQQNSSNAWRLALSIFVDVTSDGSRKYSPQARFWALKVFDDFLDNRFEPLDDDTFQTLQRGFLSYIQTEYVFGNAEANAPFLRNKFSHTLTLFFLCTYIDQWPTFFADLFALIRPSESPSPAKFNKHISLLFFHLVLEISGEVADQMIKSARTFTTQRHARDARVRDAVRERDAPRINEAVLTIVADGAERMTALRKSDGGSELAREPTDCVEIVDWGVRTFGSYVGWIDINLTVTPTTVPLLFTLLADPSLPIRLATCVALMRIVAKGLKEPGDKLQLMKVLSLGQVLGALETKTRDQQLQRGDNTDEGEESYREALGKLLNMYGLELHKLIDDCSDQAIRSEASEFLRQILPVMLRFMADEYDDTSSTIFTLLHTVLSNYKRSRKMSSEPIEDSKRTFLISLLKVILDKMKWDEETDMDDDDDVAAFENIRKELRSFLDAVLVVDQALVTEAVRTLALNTLAMYTSGIAVKWHDAELAVYLVYIFGEINKSGGKGRAAFCQAPATDKSQRKEMDYSEYPLTAHGEMLLTLVRSGISSFPHRAVVMQFFEAVARYSDFFKVRKECIMPTLEVMVDTRGLHSPDSTVRARVFYLFHRFIKENRLDLLPPVAVSLVEGIRDLLVIEVELPEVEDGVDILAEAVSAPGRFDSQIYLFETAGTLCSLLSKTPEEQSTLLLSVVKPLSDDLSASLQASTTNMEPTATLRVHHTIMALGNIAKGFPEFPTPLPQGYSPPPLEVFQQVAQAIIVCLEAMNIYKIVRDASRFAFSRILATAGPSVTQFIPALMANLLNRFEPSELADFMTFIGLLIHKLQRDMLNVLDELLGPLSSHISTILMQEVSGTDDFVTRVDTKRAFLTLLNNIMAARLHSIFTSERNKATFEPLLETVLRQVEDLSDNSGQKTALTFFGRCVTVWGQPVTGAPNGDAQADHDGIPGFERFIYERLVPTAFSVLFKPDFNVKDGQMFTVLHEVANFLQTVGKTRGPEAYEYFATAFLPAQNLPSELAVEFTTKLRDLEPKSFRKYFAEFVRSSRPPS